MQDDIREVETLMRSQADNYHPGLGSALDIILSSGGKRVRPSITLLVGQMLNTPREALITLAAAIELLHTATLVHDDLIDSSLLRRGMPTLNSLWSPGATVLTGDFLFACAARLAASVGSLTVMQLFSSTLTTIVNGEITQLLDSRCQINHDDYYRRIYAKTASLFETSAKSPALISEVRPERAENLRRYGYEIGMAFQIVDDILDFTSRPSELGKPVGSDLRQGLITLPSLYYIDSHPDDPDVIDFVRSGCLDDAGQAQRLVEAIRTSSAIDRAHQEAGRFVERAVVYLRQEPPGPQRDSLEGLAEYIVRRQL